MKRIFLLFYTLLIFCIVARTPLQAQQPDAGLKLEMVYNNYTYIDIKVSVKGSSSFGMSTSTLTFLYNTTDIGSWTVQNVSSNFSGGKYSTLSISEGWAGLMNIGIWRTGTPPTTVGTSYMEVCTIRFYIASYSNGTTNFTWQTTPGNTDVFKYQSGGDIQLNINPFENATNILLPVQLTAFTGTFIDPSVRLSWTTATETNSLRFDVERSLDGMDFNAIGFVAAQGATAIPHLYSFLDVNPGDAAQYWYRLHMVDRDGSAAYSPTIRVDAGPQAATAQLFATYPNPFNPQATVHFMLRADQAVTIALYDESGREALRLVDNEALKSGYHARILNAAHLASGKYILRMTAGSYRKSENLLIQK